MYGVRFILILQVSFYFHIGIVVHFCHYFDRPSYVFIPVTMKFLYSTKVKYEGILKVKLLIEMNNKANMTKRNQTCRAKNENFEMQ